MGKALEPIPQGKQMRKNSPRIHTYKHGLKNGFEKKLNYFRRKAKALGPFLSFENRFLLFFAFIRVYPCASVAKWFCFICENLRPSAAKLLGIS
jgi:hypothetical protein